MPIQRDGPCGQNVVNVAASTDAIEMNGIRIVHGNVLFGNYTAIYAIIYYSPMRSQLGNMYAIVGDNSEGLQVACSNCESYLDMQSTDTRRSRKDKT